MLDWETIPEPSIRARSFKYTGGRSDVISTRAPTKADLHCKRTYTGCRSHGTRGRKPKPSWKAK